MVQSVLSSVVNQQKHEAYYSLPTSIACSSPIPDSLWSSTCSAVHGSEDTNTLVIPATRTTVPWMCTPHCKYKVFMLCRICCYILHESRKGEYQKSKALIYMLSDNKIMIQWWAYFCTDHCMEVLLLAPVTIYEIWRMDLVFLCLGGRLVIRSLRNGTEYGSQKRTVIHGTEKVTP